MYYEELDHYDQIARARVTLYFLLLLLLLLVLLILMMLLSLFLLLLVHQTEAQVNIVSRV